MDTKAPRENEACSLVYGNTLEKDFPLILVIGREPNRHCNVINKVSRYGSPDGSKFWARSHELITRYTELKPREFKNRCVAHNTSPIVFSDASPLGMDSRFDGEKNKIRKNISTGALEAHTQNVFSQEPILSRTALVLISGIKGSGLDHAIPFIEQQCDSLNLPYVHIAYLVARTKNHTQSIRVQQIGEAGKAIIQSCTNQFLSEETRKAA